MKAIHLIIISLVVFLIACGQKQNSTIEKEEVQAQLEAEEGKETAKNSKSVVNLSAEQAKMAGIKSGKLKQKKMATSIKANGVIDVPPENIASIHAIMDAFVKTVRVLEGEQVKKGQVLAVLEHPEFISLQEHYLKTLAQLTYSKKDYERQQKLNAEKATALKTYQQAEMNYASLKSEVAGVEARISMLGLNLESLKQGKIVEEVYMIAPFSGTISGIFINLGQHITAQQQAIEMVNKEHIHGELEVFAQDILKINKGQQVKFTVSGSEDTIFDGEVFLVGETVNHESNTVNVHVHPHGDVSRLKLGMYISAEILLDTEDQQVVPELSVVKDEEQYYIFVDKGDYTYEMLPVETGIVQGGYCVVKGISQDLNIVTEGANYLWASL